MPNLADFMTTQDAVGKLGFHVEHIRRMCRQGKLKGVKFGRDWFIERASIDAYLIKNAALGKFDPRRTN